MGPHRGSPECCPGGCPLIVSAEVISQDGVSWRWSQDDCQKVVARRLSAGRHEVLPWRRSQGGGPQNVVHRRGFAEGVPIRGPSKRSPGGVPMAGVRWRVFTEWVPGVSMEWVPGGVPRRGSAGGGAVAGVRRKGSPVEGSQEGVPRRGTQKGVRRRRSPEGGSQKMVTGLGPLEGVPWMGSPGGCPLEVVGRCSQEVVPWRGAWRESAGRGHYQGIPRKSISLSSNNSYSPVSIDVLPLCENVLDLMF